MRSAVRLRGMSHYPILYDKFEVAARLGVCDSRVRQLALQHGLGKLYGNARLFNERDVKKLEKIRQQA